MGNGTSFESGGNMKSFVKHCLKIASFSVSIKEPQIMKVSHCKNTSLPSGLRILTNTCNFLKIHLFKTDKNS